MSNFENESGFISKFPGMKKYAAPVILFVLACALIVYLKVDFSGSSSSFDVSRYMKTRAKIDSLEVALWNAQGSVDTQVKIRDELANSWEELSAMRSNTAADEAEASEENVGGFGWRLALDYWWNACSASLFCCPCSRAYSSQEGC